MLILVARGLTNQEIAEQLRTSTNKVKIAIHQACVKLEARNRIEAVFFAIKQRNIKVDEIFSLDELVELLASLGPKMVETIAGLLRHQLDSNYFPLTDGQIPHWERKQATILTQREQDTLALVARGLTNQQIADQLYTSTSTVRTFLYQACIKLEARNRAKAVISAIRRSAIDVNKVFSLDELVELLDSTGPEVLETIVQLLRGKLKQERIPSTCQ